MLYVLSPELSSVDQAPARALLDAATHEWDDIPVAEIGAAALATCQPSAGDGVVFFNPPREDLAGEVQALLDEALRAGAVLLPIAMDAEHRRPPGAAGERQSFDVHDQLRRRELPPERPQLLGAAFAREALSMTMPTFVQSRLRIFLCHRRADGEQLTAAVDRALSARHEHVFRDLIDIQTGEQAQQRIDEKLTGADVLVFLDTPLAGESWWVAHELATALGRGIPVVWVRLGAAAGRVELQVRPAAEPHLYSEEPELSPAAAGELVDEILRIAVRLARSHARIARQAQRELKHWAAEHGARIETLDARRQIFQIRHPPPSLTRAYPLRAATDVVQFFGRAPEDTDRLALEGFLTDRGMGPHDHECRAFDAAIMLDPTATGHRAVGEWSVTEHPERFLRSLEPARPAYATGPPRLLLLGAFPAGEYARDQIVPAIHATASTWLALGGAIVCGGHPTFVPLLSEAARSVLGADARERLIVYQSQWFTAPAQHEELSPHAQVVLTAGEASRAASLTLMREQMVGAGHAAAVLALGGRTVEGGTHTPGIDEEIALARAHGLPVYLLGAPGGQAAVLAAQAAGETPAWGMLGNRLGAAGNELLASTEDYEHAARLIWRAAGGA